MDLYNRISNIKKDGSADVYIYGPVGGNAEDSVNGSYIADQIKYLSESGVEIINLRINSPGGYVQDGLSIIGAINSVDAQVNTYCDGVAASIAGIIFMCGKKRYMNDFGRLMIHNPSLPNEVNVSEQDKEAIRQIKHILGKIIENNSRLNPDHIYGMMERETWLEADVALTMHLIDEKVITEREGVRYVTNSIAEIYNTCKELLTNNKTKLSMKEVKNFLKLEEAANEDQVLNKIKNMSESIESVNNELEEIKTEVSTKETENEALKAEVEALKATIEEYKEREIVNFIKDATNKGKYSEESTQELISKAKEIGFENFKSITNSINETVSTVGYIDVTKEIENKSKTEEIENLRDLEKNNPSKIKEIYNNNFELYKRMYKSTYGVEYKGN